MKVARLVVGILTILWSLVVIVLVGFLTLIDFGAFDDFDGILEGVAIVPLVVLLGAFFLAGGIIMLVTHRRTTPGGCIACAAIFGVGLVLSIIFGGRAAIATIAFIPLFLFSIAGIIVAVIPKRKDK